MKELDDLRSMGAFLRMLETSRVERRRTARSGPVSA